MRHRWHATWEDDVIDIIRAYTERSARRAA